ncbi:RNA polymerase sigma-70 factor, ECF subfamily [bacterium A37T11]|nr:RNA polymerase sigma-70 factor, ECF subfamily [bacterium A37T11]
MKKLGPLTDAELLVLIRQNNQNAFHEIYNRYWDKLMIVASNRLGNVEEAEECVQDIFVKLWELKDTLELQNDSFSYYLSRAARNHAFDIMDKHHRERQRAEGYVPEIRLSPSAESEYLAKELKQKIDEAINQLPAQCQLVFRLSTGEGLSNKDIAEQLNISENTVKSHLKKANKDIRDNLEMFGPIVLHFAIQLYLHAS